MLQAFGRDNDFAFALTQATRGHMAAGRGGSEAQGACESAEFGDRQAAETCERDLQTMVARFSARLSATRSGWE